MVAMKEYLIQVMRYVFVHFTNLMNARDFCREETLINKETT